MSSFHGTNFRMLLYLQILSLTPLRKIMGSKDRMTTSIVTGYPIIVVTTYQYHEGTITVVWGYLREWWIECSNGTIPVHSPINSFAIIEMVPISKVYRPLSPICICASVLEWWVRRLCLQIEVTLLTRVIQSQSYSDARAKGLSKPEHLWHGLRTASVMG